MAQTIQESQLVGVSTTPTIKPGQINRIRGFSVDILAELQRTGGATTNELRRELGRSGGYLRSYLYNLYSYGAIGRSDLWGWKITAYGEAVLSSSSSSGKRREEEEKKKSKRRAKETNRQLNLSLFSSESDISEDEMRVVAVMAEHYERTGEKFRYFKDPYDFCESVEIPAVGINELLARLKEEGIIYVRKETELGMWKIGLKLAFVERLQYC
jgi:hypothetical protein